MELKDFVKKVITDLASAVSEADTELRDIKGLVNPGTHKPKQGEGSARPSTEMEFVSSRTCLNFDIAVSATSETAGNGGAKLGVSVLSLDLGGSKSKKSDEVSRISFSIDVVLPAPKDQMDRIGLVASPAKSN